MKNTLSSYFKRETKKIGFFGLGKSNLALIKLLPIGDTPVILRSDKAINRALIPHNIKIEAIYEGARSLDDISEDVLILSPSVRRDRAALALAKEKGIALTSDAELFFENANPKAPIFAITGSDGKSTTATLAARLMQKRFEALALCGNIGTPMLDKAETSDAFVTELSSFQLTYARPKARRALITNITPNHLNWHKSFEEYRDAKLSLLDEADERIICADDSTLCEYGKGKSIFAIYSIKRNFHELKGSFSAEAFITIENGFIEKNGERIIGIESILRREEHNLQNLMGAIALSDGYTDLSQIQEVAKGFNGLSHRAEFIRSINGVEYINSSIDTSPLRTAATLRAMSRPCILILGGVGKGLSYDSLLCEIKKHVRTVIVMGNNREEITSKICGTAPIIEVKNLEEAVLVASTRANIGEAILLSPSATSYDLYSSFEERGDHFRQIVLNL